MNFIHFINYFSNQLEIIYSYQLPSTTDPIKILVLFFIFIKIKYLMSNLYYYLLFVPIKLFIIQKLNTNQQSVPIKPRCVKIFYFFSNFPIGLQLI